MQFFSWKCMNIGIWTRKLDADVGFTLVCSLLFCAIKYYISAQNTIIIKMILLMVAVTQPIMKEATKTGSWNILILNLICFPNAGNSFLVVIKLSLISRIILSSIKYNSVEWRWVLDLTIWIIYFIRVVVIYSNVVQVYSSGKIPEKVLNSKKSFIGIIWARSPTLTVVQNRNLLFKIVYSLYFWTDFQVFLNAQP